MLAAIGGGMKDQGENRTLAMMKIGPSVDELGKIRTTIGRFLRSRLLQIPIRARQTFF
jgi:hypothetical protein